MKKTKWSRVLDLFLLQALLSFFEMPVDDNPLPDDHFIEIDDTPTYQTASAKLNFANNAKNDPLQGKCSFQ